MMDKLDEGLEFEVTVKFKIKNVISHKALNDIFPGNDLDDKAHNLVADWWEEDGPHEIVVGCGEDYQLVAVEVANER